MKRQFCVLSCLVVMLLIIGVSDLSAQHTYKFSDSLGTYTVKFQPNNSDAQFAVSPTKPLIPETHELRLSTSWGATNRWGGIIAWNESINNNVDWSYYRKYDIANDHYYTINLDYGYWVKEWFSIGVSATWVMGVSNIYDRMTRERLDTRHQDFVNIMPNMRFAWLRRGVVQLYSSFGLGVGIERYDMAQNLSVSNYNTDIYCAFDFKFFGLSVGRKWFGFAELGYGSRGVFNFGFGCRINSNIK